MTRHRGGTAAGQTNIEGEKSRRRVRQLELTIVSVATCLLGWWAVHVDAFEALADFVADHDAWQVDEVIIILLFAGIAAFVLLLRRARDLRAEVGRRRAAELHASTLARHDPLTGLPNRRVLTEDLEVALDALSVSGDECVVLLVDLDLFKPVNDLHGHAAGDAVLIEVATRLAQAVSDKGTVARMGGDEFACILRCAAGSDLATRVAGQIVRSLNQPILVDSKRIRIGATVGIARAPHDGTTVAELLHGADLAMYDAKRSGKGAYRFFNAEMDLHLRERSALEADLRRSIPAGQIVPHFQPIIDLKSDRILGFEALARWHHPTRGVIPPDTFIPIAEDLGLIDDLFDSMLDVSCAVACGWPASMWLSVNISPIQLKNPDLSARLLKALAKTGFAATRLVIEVTENSVIDDMVRASEVFKTLQDAGVRIALDDFGKGYSSLFHLRQLQFDHLKIDGSFIHAMDAPESLKIISAVAGLGKSLGMPVTAEGVETEDEAAALRALGCEQAQGYLFGKALDARETCELIARHGAARIVKVRAA